MVLPQAINYPHTPLGCVFPQAMVLPQAIIIQPSLGSVFPQAMVLPQAINYPHTSGLSIPSGYGSPSGYKLSSHLWVVYSLRVHSLGSVFPQAMFLKPPSG